jgi:hypothetical protein
MIELLECLYTTITVCTLLIVFGPLVDDDG